VLYDFPELVFLFCLFCLESADSRPSTNCELAGTEKGADAAGDVEFCDYRWGKCIKVITSEKNKKIGSFFLNIQITVVFYRFHLKKN